MAARIVSRKRPGILGRTDLGVEANRTGVYQVDKEEVDRNGNVTKRTKHTVFRLRRLTDGFCIDSDAGTVGEGGAPDSNRQRLERLLGKTIAVEDGGDTVELPFLFLDKPVAGGFSRVGRYPIPVADDRIRRVMADLCSQRDARIDGTKRDWERQKAEAEVDEARARETVASRRAPKKAPAAPVGAA